MNFTSVFKNSVRALFLHKLRSFLTILGIVIGITSVVIVFSAGEGIKGLVLAQVDSWGSDFLEVEIKVPSTAQASSENAGGQAMGISITTLTEADAEAIVQNPNVSAVYSAVLGQAIVINQNEKKAVTLWGVSSTFLNIDSGEVKSGRFFDEAEDKSLAKVIVLGTKLKTDLFGDNEAIGKYVKVGRQNFQVIGVMASKGAVLYMDMDSMAYIPLRTLQKHIMGIDHVSFIMAKMKDLAKADITVEEVTFLMRQRHDITDPNKDDFAVTTMADARDMLNSLLGGITLLLAAIAGVSLLVGGVGIMNIMYVSVSERINEIGLRKAVGATKKNIMSQFLIEAVILTFSGGIVGIMLGLAISYLVYLIAVSQGFDWVFVISPLSLILAVGVSAVIGLIFGLYPAKRAANMDPIKALGFE